MVIAKDFQAPKEKVKFELSKQDKSIREVFLFFLFFMVLFWFVGFFITTI